MYKILTHPIVSNYGGILQAFALQRGLQKMGVSSRVINYFSRKWGNMFTNVSFRGRLACIKQLIEIIFFAAPLSLPEIFYPSLFSAFKKRFFRLWNLDLKRTRLSALADGKPLIVGSDQVWRCEYIRNIESVPFFFLNFVTVEQRKRSIAYAASFGSDEWEGSPEETEECARLLREFKAVSVREHSGVRICREVFGVDAVQMPDPTLLLEKDDYNYLIAHWPTRQLQQPFMSVYLLDETEDKSRLVQELCKVTELPIQYLVCHPGSVRLMDRLPLSVPQWLRCIRDCECVLTDSFHGCVFSIMFNKPFVCLGNDKRGSARFDSLLGTFGLQDRIAIKPTAEQILQILNTPIDWGRVNEIRVSERERGINFLRRNLG